MFDKLATEEQRYEDLMRLLGTAEVQSDPAVVGRTLSINGRPFVVIGVAARGFHGPDRAGGVDIWVPLISMSCSMASSESGSTNV